MNPVYIILKFLATIVVVFSISFLLDVKIVQSNWLRYSIVCALAFFVLLVGINWVIQDIKKLK
tara:strand:+ start:205 stop:393 length:189 start_codon:yes stop_codon:yes gene_type:complete